MALLTGKDATKGRIEGELRRLTAAYARGDTLVVGLAGHGLQFDGDEDSYFCPVGARPFKQRADTLVSVKWIYDRLRQDAAAGPKFLLVDACRDFRDANRGSRGIDADTAPNPPKGVGVLLSCSAGERAWEHKAWGTGHGAFFHHVIEGLSGKAKDDAGDVTWDSLRAYVKREVVRSVPKVIRNQAQTPEESGRLAGAPPVLLRPAETAAGTPPKKKDETPPTTDMGKNAPAAVKAQIRLTVPQDDADVFIEGKATKATGPVREYESPPGSRRGGSTSTGSRVVWRPNNYTTLTRTLDVKFKGGDVIVVDLSKPNPKIPDKAVVRWVPTPVDIVDEMVKLAAIRQGDVVYVPGCGDGRQLIAAVKAGAKKAVGIELDPKKAAEATDNVKRAGLSDKITIIEGDALKDRDYTEATVVMMYMGTSSTTSSARPWRSS